MKFYQAVLFFTAMCPHAVSYAGQQAQTPPPQTTTPTSASPVSGLLQPSLDQLQGTLAGTRLEKWKGGSVRSEADTNIASIRKDLQGPLPKLIAVADSAPGVMSKTLLVARNLDALYDVLVRVVDGSRVAAPGDQVDQLQQAMAAVEKARLALSDRLQEMAAGNEKQIVDLQASLKSQPAPVCPVITAPPPPATAAPKKKVVKKKPATPPGPKPPPQTQTPAKPNP